MKRQLILISDMEGASGIFEENKEAMLHGSNLWRKIGRKFLTSDILAVCEAANESNIDEIMLYDGHFAGNAEHNILLELLPSNVKIFDTENRCFDWRRIRGQADQHPIGVITVGQHARYGETDSYFPHTISYPITKLKINTLTVSELGESIFNFCGIKYLANIGDTASMKEALEISPNVSCIPVKDRLRNWKPTPYETFQIIKSQVKKAISSYSQKDYISLDPPYSFYLEVEDDYYFNYPKQLTWVGKFHRNKAYWTAPSLEIGLELFNYVRELLVLK